MARTLSPKDLLYALWKSRRLSLLPPVVLALLLVLPTTISAQYFGRNKVQYDDFNFRVLHTEHFAIHFYEGQSARMVEDFGRMAERWYERFARAFQFTFRERKPILVYSNKPDFQQTNAIPGFISQATGGVTESLKDRIVMPLAPTHSETEHVLGHELVHAFQFELVRTQRGGGATAFDRVPMWLIEGMPEYLSLGPDDTHTAMWMRDAVLHDDVPSIRDLNREAEYFPYRFGHALFAYIAGTYGDATVPLIFRRAGERGLQRAFLEVLDTPQDSLSRDWVEAVKSYYGPLLEGRTPPEEAGRRVLAPEKDAGEMNLSPSLSPDGKLVAFFSERDLLSINLFLADAETGNVRRTLASAARNPHFDELFFISSTGAWSPDGSRFAFITIAEGDNQIAIVRVGDPRVERTLSLDGVGAVFALDWSPDGSTILFSGSVGGVTDLFLVDVSSGAIERLTDDTYAELMPAFSPDGETVAFVTDRGPGADLDLLTFPSLGLGFLDISSGQVEVIRPLGQVKHINPQWSPDGESLYFISDRAGFSDIYRLELASEEVYQVTRLATGVTGISNDAPAMSVARESGDLMFTVFEDGQYIGYALGPDEARGEAVLHREVEAPAGRLPPSPPPREPSFVVQYLADDTTGLLPRGTFRETDYSPGLQLDYLAQPTVGVAVDRFGTALGGSVAAFFSDMLGNHQLGVAVQAQGQVQDIGGQAAYFNQERRLNWGAQAGRIPFRTGFTRGGFTEVNGEDLLVTDFVISRTILHRGMTIAQYPFSLERRLEMNAGASHIGFQWSYGFLCSGRIVSVSCRFSSSRPNSPSSRMGA